MRGVVIDGAALALDALWLLAGAGAFFAPQASARRRGMLLQIGE